jgi:hypothetical protein
MYVWPKTEVRSSNHCFSGKTISITYSGNVFALFGIQCAMRMGHTVICGLPGCTIFFHIFLINVKILYKKILVINCVYWFSLQLWKISSSKKNSARYYKKKIFRSSCKLTVILSYFKETWIFPTFLKGTQT